MLVKPTAEFFWAPTLKRNRGNMLQRGVFPTERLGFFPYSQHVPECLLSHRLSSSSSPKPTEIPTEAKSKKKTLRERGDGRRGSGRDSPADIFPPHVKRQQKCWMEKRRRGEGRRVYFGPTHAKLMPGLFSLAGADEGREEERGSGGM